MAEKRMFSKKITNSDAFLDMPLSAQCLYFHLNMEADDDGFVNNPKKTMRFIGANEDDMKLLITKRFVLVFESGVIVIKHWRMNNTLKSDRYKPTDYQEEFALLGLKTNKSYTWKQIGSKMVPQNRLDKNRLDKKSIESEIKIKEQNKQIKEVNKRNKYGEYKHVLLSEEQHTRLIQDYGTDLINEYIKKIDEYIQLKGKGYKDYNLAIRKWLANDNKVKSSEKGSMYETWE